jgi:hypothetical protein
MMVLTKDKWANEKNDDGIRKKKKGKEGSG